MYIKKGYLLYEPKDIKRNAGFIELFLAEARQKNITLSLLYANDQRLLRAKKTDEHSLADALGNPDFIISRSRTPSLSKMLEQSGIRVYNNADIC
ncbi:MAG TPA: hypothetical protein PLU43_08490, partial [Lachnospiraceae bacterium]|nr:hypothetical protein [Lachnospiraceae bacterium]